MELLVQVQGQEGEDIVLGRVDDVLLEGELAWGSARLAPPGLHPPAEPPATDSMNRAPTGCRLGELGW